MLAPNTLTELYNLVQQHQDKHIEGPVHAALIRRMSPKDLIKAIARFQYKGSVLSFFSLKKLERDELALVSTSCDLELEQEVSSADELKIASPGWYTDQVLRLFRKIPDDLPRLKTSFVTTPYSS